MSNNRTLDVNVTNNLITTAAPSKRRRKLAKFRSVNPWLLFGWLRRRINQSTSRQFYSHAEKQRHQHAKMAQRVSNYHHGFKF